MELIAIWITMILFVILLYGTFKLTRYNYIHWKNRDDINISITTVVITVIFNFIAILLTIMSIYVWYMKLG